MAHGPLVWLIPRSTEKIDSFLKDPRISNSFPSPQLEIRAAFFAFFSFLDLEFDVGGVLSSTH